MMNDSIFKEAKAGMEKGLTALKGEFSRLRTGRASPSLLEPIRVECYGTQMPIHQVAGISVVEGRTLVISPWDKGVIPEIERGIQKSDLGLTPVNDGKVIRITMPSPTEERRKELVRQAKKMAEEARVSIRNCRRDTNEEIKNFQKEGKISEDELRKGEAEIQRLTDQMTRQVDELLAHKEKEILEV